MIFLDGPPNDWRRAALSLGNACPGLTYADAARACRFSRGFLDLVLAPEQLEAAAAALTNAGSPARVLPLSARVPVSPAFTPLRLGIDDLALSCLEPKNPAFARIAWKRVRLLHLAWVGPGAARSRALPDDLAAPRAMLGLRPAEEAASASREPPELWLELVLSEPTARLRIRMSSFVYDCLPEPAPRSEDNLRALVKLLAAHAPKALESGLVERCLAGEPLDASEPLDAQENDRAVSWALTRLNVHASPAPEPPPPAEPQPERPEEPLDRLIALMSRYRRVALLSASILLAIPARMLVLESYGRVAIRMLWFIQLVVWVPILLVLTLGYVAVQMRLETLKRRRDGTPVL